MINTENLEPASTSPNTPPPTALDMEIEEEFSPEEKTEPIVKAEEIAVIPDRIYFRIGDVAEITGIKPYVLRFWEKEFEIISPVKNNSGQPIS